MTEGRSPTPCEYGARNQAAVDDDGLGMTETEAGAPDVTSIDVGEIPPTEEAPTTAGPRRPWKQALAADLRAAIPDASLALLVTVLAFALALWRAETDRSETVILVLDRTGGHRRPDRYPTAEEIRADNADG
jgi:hypothetical protein